MRRAADLCTWLRVALAAPFAWAVFAADGAPALLPLAIYAAAAASDFADGRLARAVGTASARGRLFDHGADALFLFPALIVMAALGRVPVLLPAAATVAFGLYLADGRRRGTAGASLELAPSQVGAVAGVANYVVAGVVAATLWLGPSRLDGAVWTAALVVALANAAAVVERVLRVAGGARPEVRLP